MDLGGLKQLLLEEAHDAKYKNENLINIYLKDPSYVKRKVKEGVYSTDALDFLDNNVQRLLTIDQQISIPFFRNAKFEELINDHSEWKELEEKKKMAKDQNKTVTISVKKLAEIKQDSLRGEADATAKEWMISHWNTKATIFLQFLYEATESGSIKWYQASSGKSFKILLDNDHHLKLRVSEHQGKILYRLKRDDKINLTYEEFNRLFLAITGVNCTIKEVEKKEKRVEQKHIEQKIIKNDEKTTRYTLDVYGHIFSQKDLNAKKTSDYVLRLKSIEKLDDEFFHLIGRTYFRYLKWEKINVDFLSGDVYVAIDTKGNKMLVRKYTDGAGIFTRLFINGEKIDAKGLQHHLEILLQGMAVKGQASSYDIRTFYPMHTLEKKEIVNLSVNKEVQPKETKKRRVNIGIKDFVVRRHVFQCMHKKHKLEDIDAVIKIMNKNIQMEEVVVAAGYCKQCKTYFILESTYQQISKRGIVACRSTDEKSYLNQTYMNGKKLAQESILMQFGYTVSQAEGLSEERRQKILSVLVDNHILTKSEIISYLDFFISQRKNDKFARAVAKWELDRNYIRNYKVGEYSRIGVIYKNK